jgi:hypothetical protein
MTVPVVLVDFDCKLDRAHLADVAEMLTVTSQTEFARQPPFGYGHGAQVRVGAGPHDVAPGECVMGFWKHPDTPGALGYHFAGPDGRPLAKCFPYLDEELLSGITESHELFELLADTDCVTAVVGADGIVRAREPGDPVEAFSRPYTCASGRVLKVSDWVTPAYFAAPEVNATGLVVPYDAMGLVRSPGAILEGGYQILWDARKREWTQTTTGALRPYRAALRDHGRVSRYAHRKHVGAPTTIHGDGPSHPSPR